MNFLLGHVLADADVTAEYRLFRDKQWQSAIE